MILLSLWFQNAPPTNGPSQWLGGSRANFYTDQAILRIRDRNRSRPFYLHQTYQSVHKLFEEPPSWEEMPEGEWWDHVRF